jgi:hypothetical protein
MMLESASVREARHSHAIQDGRVENFFIQIFTLTRDMISSLVISRPPVERAAHFETACGI